VLREDIAHGSCCTKSDGVVCAKRFGVRPASGLRGNATSRTQHCDVRTPV